MDDLSSKNYISWPILTLMAFVTVIGFDDIMYNFQKEKMVVILVLPFFAISLY